MGESSSKVLGLKLSLLRRAVGVGHSLDRVATVFEIHNRNSGNFTNSPAEIFVTSRDDKALVLRDSLSDAVVGVGAFMHAGETLESGILGYPEGDLEFGPQLFDFRHDAVGNVWNAFGVETVHHRLPNVQLVLNRKVDKIRVHQNVEGWTQIGVVSEKHG